MLRSSFALLNYYYFFVLLCPVLSNSLSLVLRNLSFHGARFYHWELASHLHGRKRTQVLASFAQVVLLKCLHLPCILAIKEYISQMREPRFKMASAPGATTVRGSEQSLPQQARSQPGGLGAACASFLPPRVPGEMWQKLLPCRKAHGFLPGQT